MTAALAPASMGVRHRLAPLLSVVAGQGLASATSFATVLALGRWGGDAALGQFALGWTCWFLALSLGDTLVATPYTWLRSQPPASSSRRIDLPAAAAWGIAAICLAFALALTGLWIADLAAFSSLSLLWPALPIALAAASLREFARRHLLALGRGTQVLRIDASGSLLQCAGIAALAATQRLTAPAALWVVAVAALLSVLPLWQASLPRRLLAARADVAAVGPTMFRYGRWLLLGGVCHVATVQAYPWLAYAAGGQKHAGLFAACVALANLLSPVLTALTNHFRPKFMQAQATQDGAAFGAYVRRRLPVFVLPALLWCGVLMGTGELLLSRVYGSGFAPAAPALGWLALGGVAVAIAAPVQLALLALRAPASNLAYHGSALAMLAVVLTVAMLSRSTLPALSGLGQLYAAMSLLSCGLLVAWFIRSMHSRLRA